MVFLVAATAFAGCTVTAPESVKTLGAPVPTAVATPISEASSATEATDPDSCAGLSQVVSESDGLYWERRGSLRETLARVGRASTFRIADQDFSFFDLERKARSSHVFEYATKFIDYVNLRVL